MKPFPLYQQKAMFVFLSLRTAVKTIVVVVLDMTHPVPQVTWFQNQIMQPYLVEKHVLLEVILVPLGLVL